MRGEKNETAAVLVGVSFEPDGIEIHVPVGTTIGKAALSAGCAVEMTCGGMGTCGKCRVIVSGEVSAPDQSERRLLSEEDLSSGARLACRTKLAGDAKVTIPAQSRSVVQKILSHSIDRHIVVAPEVQKIYLELPEPSLEDERGDFERLSDALIPFDINATIGLRLARELPNRLRTQDFKVTAVVTENELIAVEPGNTANANYGIAFDLGSTTMVGYLIDLNTGNEVAVAPAMNSQMAYGDDLVSRINFATKEPNGLSMLRKTALDALNSIIRRLVEQCDVSSDNIYEVTLVGNTCMSHVFLGLDISTLGVSPYVPTVSKAMTISADEAELKVNPGARIYVLPNVAGFVGSDLIAVALSTLREDENHTRIAVDVGTNGEMVLVHNGKMYACSAAAGPAFEGAGISCGMRGGPGAIDSVRIGDEVEITTVDDKRAIGLCGSGLVDAIATMLDAGIIDSTGRMIGCDEAESLPEAVRERLIEVDGTPQFVLATARETAVKGPITLTQADVRQLQLGKGSIRAAIETLLTVAGASSGDLSAVYLAGGFGNYIRKESAVRIGLIPPIDEDKIIPVGNAAGAGAKLALISARERQRANCLAEMAQHIELACHPDYQMEFMDKMLFPEPEGKTLAV